MSSKKCEKCGSKFTRMGSSCGLLGNLICFILFGGTSKYCPSCRASLKEQGEKVDKGPLFRLIWLIVVVGIIIAYLKLA